MDRGLKIGELARRAGVTPKAIRFYETKGILAPASRGSNRYRLYGQDAVEMLCFIKQATGLGLTLAEIKEIIAIRQGGRPPCTHVHQLLRDKAMELDRKLKDLLEVRRRIRQSLSAWKRSRPRRGVVCGHIEAQPTAPRSIIAGKTRRKAVKQLELGVSGMTCRACEQRIEKALARIEGVVQSAADHRAAQVRVMFDPARASENALRSCIERAGYRVAP
jgi:DNA-binding transcriptional MerR regulator